MINRREFLECAGGTLATGAVAGFGLVPDALAQTQPASAPAPDFHGRFDDTPDRVWLGPDYWANPMEDWHVAGGRIECIAPGGNRNVHLLTRALSPRRGGFALAVRAGLVEKGVRGSLGFRIGIRDSIDDYRGNCIFGKGLDAGIDDGVLRIGEASHEPEAPLPLDDLLIELRGEPAPGAREDAYNLSLTVKEPASGRVLAAMKAESVAAEDLIGNLALVNNFAAQIKKGSRFWFTDWRVSGEKSRPSRSRPGPDVRYDQARSPGPGTARRAAGEIP